MKRKSKMNEETFTQRTGYVPIDDDLERVNCDSAGKLGHKSCGVCKHDNPLFLSCSLCEKEGIGYNKRREV